MRLERSATVGEVPAVTTIRTIDVLVICTGNQCRSPMAMAILRDRVARLGLEAGVTSAGLVSEGVPASEESVRAVARRGLDLSAHRSTPLTADAVAEADLVIGMTREHVREAVVLIPDALPRSFTLRELVRRAEAAGPRHDTGPGDDALEAETLAAWLGRIGADRQLGDLMGESEPDDLADPMGQSRRSYERTAREIEDLVDRFVNQAFPGPTSRSYST